MTPLWTSPTPFALAHRVCESIAPLVVWFLVSNFLVARPLRYCSKLPQIALSRVYLVTTIPQGENPNTISYYQEDLTEVVERSKYPNCELFLIGKGWLFRPRTSKCRSSYTPEQRVVRKTKQKREQDKDIASQRYGRSWGTWLYYHLCLKNCGHIIL